MSIFLNQKFFRNPAAFIAILIVVGNYCLGIQGNLNDAELPVDYDNLWSAEYSNQVDDEVNVATSSTTAAGLLQNQKLSPYLNVSQHPGELCNRVCVSGQRRICYFQFHLEYYQVMGAACGRCAAGVENDCNNPQCIVADGVEKGAMSINRQIPGPAIQVCKDDFIIVEAINSADGSAATIHWHGLHMRKTPFMDGVPFLTQCPIPYNNKFLYYMYATEAGTQFYHSHSGHHKSNGQYGALIIRRPEEPLRAYYDYDLPEHHIFIVDWMHQFAEQHFPGLPNAPTLPDAVLINGRGIFVNPATNQRTSVRPITYYVQSGKRYRFRLINSANHVCAFQLQIQQHKLAVISSDSFDVLPYPVDTLMSNAGERYDFIVHANHTNGDFWLRVRGLGPCAARQIESYALIRYKTSQIDSPAIPPFPKYEEPYPAGLVFNSPISTCIGEENNHCVTKLTSIEEDADLLNSIPDHKFFLAFENQRLPLEKVFEEGQYRRFANIGGNIVLAGAINNISLAFPDFPPLAQPNLLYQTEFCNSFNMPTKCVGETVCHCIHRLQVNLNSIVELVIVDENAGNAISHPFHLHGYRFMVTGMGQLQRGVPMTLKLAQDIEAGQKLPRNYASTRPPFKDTVSIPNRGYAIVRFRASNPGFWLLHCHYEWHLSTGMGLILQVGDTTQMVQAPKDFPKCGNYISRIKSSDISV